MNYIELGQMINELQGADKPDDELIAFYKKKQDELWTKISKRAREIILSERG